MQNIGLEDNISRLLNEIILLVITEPSQVTNIYFGKYERYLRALAQYQCLIA